MFVLRYFKTICPICMILIAYDRGSLRGSIYKCYGRPYVRETARTVQGISLEKYVFSPFSEPILAKVYGRVTNEIGKSQ